MKIKWKKVKAYQPYCSICGEQIQGNNSKVFPYRCKCGTWQSSFNDPLDYKLYKLANQSKE